MLGAVFAHQDFNDETDSDYLLLSQREKSTIELDKSNLDVTYLTKQYKLSNKFSDALDFVERGDVILTYIESTKEISQVQIIDKEINQDLEKEFEEKCANDELYQLSIAELDLMTSMSACYYLKTSGLNDTIIFQTDSTNTGLVGIQIDVKDIKHLASLEKNPKKKRLMQEKQFTQRVGKGIVSKMIDGSSPTFMLPQYSH